MTDRRPRMYCVQPAVTAHFRQAFARGEREAAPYGDPTQTIAQSIAADARFTAAAAFSRPCTNPTARRWA